MQNKNNLITHVPYDVITGPLPYNLTNDYMFKATLQECSEARSGLIGALLGIDPAMIEAEVINPIELGKSIASKDFYLDVKVVVNKTKTMNLEMQVRDWGETTVIWCVSCRLRRRQGCFPIRDSCSRAA